MVLDKKCLFCILNKFVLVLYSEFKKMACPVFENPLIYLFYLEYIKILLKTSVDYFVSRPRHIMILSCKHAPKLRQGQQFENLHALPRNNVHLSVMNITCMSDEQC